MENLIKVVLKKANQEAQVIEIEQSLKMLQQLVGGYIEMVECPGVDKVDIILNEEGKLLDLPMNIALPEYEDIAFGDIVFAGVNHQDGDTISLTDGQIINVLLYCKKNQYKKLTDLNGDDVYIKGL